MQNFNSFLVICALLATANGVNSGHAQDTDAQVKARQALRQKMTQVGEAPAASQDTPEQAKAREALRMKVEGIQPTAVQPTAAQPVAVQPTAAQPTTAAITKEPQLAPADSQAIEKARQAVRQKLDELNSGTADSPEVAKAREALRRKLNQAPVQPVVAETKTQAVKSDEKAAKAQDEAQSKTEKAMKAEAENAEAAAQAERRARYKTSVNPGAFQPIESPALPISNEKQQRLAELLKKYRADQLSPEEYHQERAKILAGQ